MRAGASIAKKVVRRIDEPFAIERESPFADPGESVNRFKEQSSAPKPPQSRPSTAQTQSYDIRTSFSACAGAFDLTPYSGSSDSGGGRGADAGGVRDECLKGARAERAAWRDGKICQHYQAISDARSSASSRRPIAVPRARDGRAFRPRRESLLRAKNSLRVPCSGKKFPASPLREFCRKDLKSNAFSGRIFPQKAEFPANSPCAGNFSPYPASKSAKGALTQVNDVPTVPFKLIENFEGASRCGRRRRQGRWV